MLDEINERREELNGTILGGNITEARKGRTPTGSRSFIKRDTKKETTKISTKKGSE